MPRLEVMQNKKLKKTRATPRQGVATACSLKIKKAKRLKKTKQATPRGYTPPLYSPDTVQPVALGRAMPCHLDN